MGSVHPFYIGLAFLGIYVVAVVILDRIWRRMWKKRWERRDANGKHSSR